jgi:hypothetical protein
MVTDFFEQSVTDAVSSKLTDEDYIDDLNRKWYVIVGLKFITTFFVMIFSPHIFNCFLINPLLNCIRKVKMKTAKVHVHAKNLSYGPEFYLPARLASAVCLIYICMAFSSGIPILYFLTSAIFFTTYYVEKYAILNYWSIPKQIDSTMNNQALSFLKFVTVIHLVFAIYFYSEPGIFP